MLSSSDGRMFDVGSIESCSSQAHSHAFVKHLQRVVEVAVSLELHLELRGFRLSIFPFCPLPRLHLPHLQQILDDFVLDSGVLRGAPQELERVLYPLRVEVGLVAGAEDVTEPIAEDVACWPGVLDGSQPFPVQIAIRLSYLSLGRRHRLLSRENCCFQV